MPGGRKPEKPEQGLLEFCLPRHRWRTTFHVGIIHCVALLTLAILCTPFLVTNLVLVPYVDNAFESDAKAFSECSERPSLFGYPAVESHQVQTADDVTLTLWRVPGDRSRPLRPILVLSGLECSARDWFTGLGAEALPWVFWRAGFDVWLGNNRGTFLTTTPRWNWTFTSMADFDLPAMIDAVVRTTGAASLAYIGHSQGALQAFMHFSKNATTAARISHFAAWAPSLYLTQRHFFWNALSFLRLDVLMKRWNFSGTSLTKPEAMQRHKCSVKCSACANDMGGSFMEGHQGFASTCEEKFRCIPAGTSSDNMQVFAETLRNGGLMEYLAKLGQPIAFTNLQMPVSLAVGDMDLFMLPADVRRIEQQCSPGVVVDVQVLRGFGHMDLVWGTEAPDVLFKPLVERLSLK